MIGPANQNPTKAAAITMVLTIAVAAPKMKSLIKAIAPHIETARRNMPAKERLFEIVTMYSFCWRRKRIRWPMVGASSRTVASATAIRTPK